MESSQQSAAPLSGLGQLAEHSTSEVFEERDETGELDWNNVEEIETEILFQSGEVEAEGDKDQSGEVNGEDNFEVPMLYPCEVPTPSVSEDDLTAFEAIAHQMPIPAWIEQLLRRKIKEAGFDYYDYDTVSGHLSTQTPKGFYWGWSPLFQKKVVKLSGGRSENGSNVSRYDAPSAPLPFTLMKKILKLHQDVPGLSFLCSVVLPIDAESDEGTEEDEELITKIGHYVLVTGSGSVGFHIIGFWVPDDGDGDYIEESEVEAVKSQNIIEEKPMALAYAQKA